ncbi:MAG: phenylalanine--tRNA ligase subunit alpha [Clostridiales bacterium]|nr:phenylalanine--tRNA ligase subunit alpha [Clostridiales bacterium]
MLDMLAKLKSTALSAIAATRDMEALKELRVRFLGKKGELTVISRSMGNLSPEERPGIGQAVNLLKEKIEQALQEHMERLAASRLSERLLKEKVDVTLPGRAFAAGGLHPLSLITGEIEDIFTGMGYQIAEGPQVELDHYSFELLNIPKGHPAREMQDSFYFSENVLLRPHTSPVQARTMQKMAPQLPVKIICPGTVYRRDDDATHSPMFHQVEGLLVDKRVALADLKGTLLAFARRMFGAEREIRLRPSYFPFTEPSAEVDISCFACGGEGCRLCKGSGWIEILGAGMVHPSVLQMSGYDPDKVSGFAFGMGVERIAMLKYGINDMRLLFENDTRFLSQF